MGHPFDDVLDCLEATTIPCTDSRFGQSNLSSNISDADNTPLELRKPKGELDCLCDALSHRLEAGRKLCRRRIGDDVTHTDAGLGMDSDSISWAGRLQQILDEGSWIINEPCLEQCHRDGCLGMTQLQGVQLIEHLLLPVDQLDIRDAFKTLHIVIEGEELVWVPHKAIRKLA